MSMSLYYEAKRKNPLTEQEKAACDEIMARYSSEYPFEKKHHDFGMFHVDVDDTVFCGATNLPMSNPQHMYDVANYWLKCLTELTKLLSDCKWTVEFEGVDLILDENEGWRFPTDEEYNRR